MCYVHVISDRIFLISSRYPDRYDYPAFTRAVENELKRALDVKLARAMARKTDIRTLYRAM